MSEPVQFGGDGFRGEARVEQLTETECFLGEAGCYR